MKRAHTESLILLSGSLLTGGFDGDSLHSESGLFLRNGAIFKSGAKLLGAKIDGNVDISGASFDGRLNADALQVGGMLLMRSEGENKASFKDVVLRGAKITGAIYMNSASFDELDAESLIDGCLLEGVAAEVAKRALFRARDRQVQAALAIIARDEASHAELAWDVVRWCR